MQKLIKGAWLHQDQRSLTIHASNQKSLILSNHRTLVLFTLACILLLSWQESTQNDSNITLKENLMMSCPEYIEQPSQNVYFIPAKDSFIHSWIEIYVLFSPQDIGSEFS